MDYLTIANYIFSTLGVVFLVFVLYCAVEVAYARTIEDDPFFDEPYDAYECVGDEHECVGDELIPINSYDLDGVIYLGEGIKGLRPDENDIIITGRSYEEEEETETLLEDLDIRNDIYYNSLSFNQKTRTTSGEHKALTLNRLRNSGCNIQCHFEDDPIQAEVIKFECPWLHVIMIQHDLTEKENVRHYREQVNG